MSFAIALKMFFKFGGALLTFLVEMWRTRIGMGVIVGVVCFLIGSWHGSSKKQAEWDAARKDATEKVQQIDNNLAAKGAATDEQNERQDEAAIQTDEEIIHATKIPDSDPCRWNPGALEQLHRLQGRKP